MAWRASAIRLVTDQAEAVLAILAKREDGRPSDETDWRRLFEADGYRRLRAREAAMHDPLEDAEFRRFVMSDALRREAGSLRRALSAFERVDLGRVTERAKAYLPPEARIRGTIYPVIKPKANSFVFEMETDPALFVALNPGRSAPRLENTLVHEIHHWGLASCCPSADVKREIAAAPKPVRFACEALTAFGEGLAMLAAAGGPDVHPHASGGLEDRARWDRDVENFNRDLSELEAFFVRVLDGEYATEEELFRAAMPFLGETQGPWYTVGWQMARTVETARGRPALIECMRDLRRLLVVYNGVASELNRSSDAPLARWSDPLIGRLGAGDR